MQLPKFLGKLGCKAIGYIGSFEFAQRYKQLNPEVDIKDCFKGNSALPVSFYKEIIDKKNKDVKFDFIFIEQNGYSFKNDVDIPVIYYHRDTPTPLFMFDMDILLYRFEKMHETIAEEFPEIWDNGIMKARWLNGVDMYEFLHTKEKVIKGINWIGWTQSFDYYWQFPKQRDYYEHVRSIVEECVHKNTITFHQHGLNYSEYKDVLQRCEAVMIIPGKEAYVTRKMYEAAVSRTLMVIYAQNNKAMEVFNEIGLKPNENCICFENAEQIGQLQKIWKNPKFQEKKKMIVKNAFYWVSNNHTWLNRGRELLQLLEIYNREFKKS